MANNIVQTIITVMLLSGATLILHNYKIKDTMIIGAITIVLNIAAFIAFENILRAFVFQTNTTLPVIARTLIALVLSFAFAGFNFWNMYKHSPNP
jgi:hypothetical protein